MSEKKPLRVAALRFRSSVAFAGESMSVSIGPQHGVSSIRPCALDEAGLPVPVTKDAPAVAWVIHRKYQDRIKNEPCDEVAVVHFANIASVQYIREDAKK
jgi:hypothetical protein